MDSCPADAQRPSLRRFLWLHPLAFSRSWSGGFRLAARGSLVRMGIGSRGQLLSEFFLLRRAGVCPEMAWPCADCRLCWGDLGCADAVGLESLALGLPACDATRPVAFARVARRGRFWFQWWRAPRA